MLEQSLITHCAPTLAGLKTAGLFCFSYTSESMLQAELRRCRLALGNKGVRIRVLRRHRGRALLYVYRPAKLRQDFQKPGVAPFLQRMGYALQPEIALGQLEQGWPGGQAAPMRSASSWAIPWRTWWASWKTEVRIASTPVAGRSIPTWPRPGSDSPSLNGASPFMRFNFRGERPFHSSRFPGSPPPEAQAFFWHT
ncbi:MAG: DUF3793 family protein [Oscillospiraceae bacterium]